MLFTAAKVSHLAALPQGQPEREKRTLAMVATQDSLGFGGCTNIGECAAVCPKEIPMESIARLNRELLRASIKRGRRI
jgi:succinate dehydrogenase / fumarate reductase iron-sulfur subunit